MLLDLPNEILTKILAGCDAANVAQSCRSLAAIAYFTPSLWSSIHLGPAQFVPNRLDFLRIRLERARTSPLQVSIYAPCWAIISDMCSALAGYTAQISRLEISAHTSQIAGTILHNIFLNAFVVSPALRVLSIQVYSDPGYYETGLMYLDNLLEHATEKFPALHTLALPVHFDCIPQPGALAPFVHLHTLKLDGSLQEYSDSPNMALISALLHQTPMLETLWFKTRCREPTDTIQPPTQGPLYFENNYPVHIPVTLPCLTRLAISTPGAGLEILHCIEAPSLRDLHLDGSREPDYEESWADFESNLVWEALQKLAQRSPGLRRLAVTEVYLPRLVWRWLMVGDGQVVPFPKLESIAAHDLDLASGEVRCGLNAALLRRYSRHPRLPLRRLALPRCYLNLNASDLVQASEIAIRGAPNEMFELEIDSCCRGVTDEHLETLRARGVKLVYHPEVYIREKNWWERDHDMDISDSFAY